MKSPSHDEWNDLQLVAESAEAIVADAETTSNALLGLLQVPSSYSAKPVSRLKWSIDHPTLMGTYAPEMRLPKILLGIESIGNNRHERVIRLTERLRELGAYQWLSAQSAYGDALETLNRIAKTDPEYAKDIREFLLLSSLVQPFQLLLFERIHNFDPPYPTVNEVKSARANANNLLEFLHNKGSIYGVIDVPIMLEGALKKFERAVSEITRTYRKPRNDKTIRERDYRDRLIRSIYGYFGKCSPALISKLLTLVDYEHDVRELNKHIKNLTDKSRRKATVATL